MYQLSLWHIQFKDLNQEPWVLVDYVGTVWVLKRLDKIEGRTSNKMTAIRSNYKRLGSSNMNILLCAGAISKWKFLADLKIMSSEIFWSMYFQLQWGGGKLALTVGIGKKEVWEEASDYQEICQWAPWYLWVQCWVATRVDSINLAGRVA